MNTLFALLILIGDVTGGTTFKLADPYQPTTIKISHGTTEVDILANGKIEFAPGTTLDEAAKAFWKVVETSNPLRSKVLALQQELVESYTYQRKLISAFNACENRKSK